MNEPVTIHTDGACTGNPGPGGFAAILVSEEIDFHATVTGGDPATTNNRMELSAVIEAIRLVNSVPKFQRSHVTVHSDSKYVTDAFNEKWIEGWQRNNWRTSKKKPVLNQDLWLSLLEEIAPHRATFVWVRGHSGDVMNERCDRLAVEQAAYAPSQKGYWSSAGNPITQVPAATPTAQQEPPQTLLPDTGHLMEQVGNIISDALESLKNGKSWKTAQELEQALEQIETHRKLTAKAMSPQPQGTNTPQNDLPF